MDNTNDFLNKVMTEVVQQLEVIADLMYDDGRFSDEVYQVEEARIAIEDKLRRMEHEGKN